MKELILLFVSAGLVNNIILSRFLGVCPFMGVSRSSTTAAGMSLAVAFVMTVSSAAAWLAEKTLLSSFGDLGYLRTLVFILIIASLVQFVEMVLEKSSPQLYSSLGIFLPLITTNCAILGVALINVQQSYSFVETLVFSLGTSGGFALALILFSGLRRRIDSADVPAPFKDVPIAFITAGIMALAFMGFSGLVKL